MKVYEAVFNEQEQAGVFAVSLVENPAMQDEWIALSEHKIELTSVDDDKKLLLGASLIPDKKIYRNQNGHEFYLTFSADTIRQLAHSYNKNQNNNNATYEHEVKLSGMSVVENWIVEDPKNDKSNVFGKEYPKGTWVTMMHVDNDEVWDRVKKGEVKGFSIEALTGIEKINLNLNIMTKDDLKGAIDDLKSFLTSNKKEETKEIEAPKEEVKLEEAPKEEAKEVKAEEGGDLSEIKEMLKALMDMMASKMESEKEEKIEMSKEAEKKEQEVKELKSELSKQPEVGAIKAKPKAKVIKEVLSEGHTIKSRVFENLNNFFNN